MIVPFVEVTSLYGHVAISEADGYPEGHIQIFLSGFEDADEILAPEQAEVLLRGLAKHLGFRVER